VACGHVHLQWLRRIGRAFWFCVGSAGLAYEHVEPLQSALFEPFAEYAVLTIDDGRLRLEFRRVPLQLETLLNTIATSGMPNAELFADNWRRH
jgi:hypothetical protein